jgi:hypothetical protein
MWKKLVHCSSIWYRLSWLQLGSLLISGSFFYSTLFSLSTVWWFIINARWESMCSPTLIGGCAHSFCLFKDNLKFIISSSRWRIYIARYITNLLWYRRRMEKEIFSSYQIIDGKCLNFNRQVLILVFSFSLGSYFSFALSTRHTLATPHDQ